jgi:hypothetical protein
MNRTTRIAPARKLNVKAGWRLSVAVVAALVLSVFASSLAVADTEAFHASYQGTFILTFGSGGSSVLDFSGSGVATLLGSSTVSGRSQLQQTSPTCTTIVQDKVTLTAVNGDQVFVRNSGQDCFDSMGHITGSGTYTITGGTGRFSSASGTGTFSVTAQVTSPPGPNASGTFNPLTFDGTISVPDNQ